MYLMSVCQELMYIVAKRVKCWAADLVVPSPIPESGNHLNRKRVFIVQSLSAPFHCPDINEILLKRT